MRPEPWSITACLSGPRSAYIRQRATALIIGSAAEGTANGEDLVKASVELGILTPKPGEEKAEKSGETSDIFSGPWSRADLAQVINGLLAENGYNRYRK